MKNHLCNISISSQPIANVCEINVNTPIETEGNIHLIDLKGEKVADIFNGKLNVGNNSIIYDFSMFTNGTYFIIYNDKIGSKSIKVIVSH